MKLTVKYYLYARMGAPNTSAQNPYYLEPGYQLEIDDVTIGEALDGNPIWYHGTDGHYYWSGGIAETEFVLPGKTVESLGKEQEFMAVAAAQEFYDPLFRQIVPGYRGTGVGSKNDDITSPFHLIVYVDKRLPADSEKKKVPEYVSFRGIRIDTDVKELKNFKSQEYRQMSDKEKKPLDFDVPLQMGGSIVLKGSNEYGTRGMLVSKNNKLYILTCFHVLLEKYKNNGQFSHNTDIVMKNQQPIIAEFPCVTHHDSHPTIIEGIVEEGSYGGCHDYALVAVNKGQAENKCLDRSFGPYYTPGEIKGLKGREIIMVGATSNIQSAVVTTPKASLTFDDVAFHNIIITEKLSEGGDSGAPVMDKSNRLIGYIFKGDGETQSLVLPVYKLNLTIV